MIKLDVPFDLTPSSPFPPPPYRPLYYLGMQIFKQFEMCDVLNIDEDVLAQWLKVRRGCGYGGGVGCGGDVRSGGDVR